MGGADEAGRHPLELVRSGLLARTELTRALAGDVAERAPERSQALPAGLERDLGDGQVRVAEQRRGPLDSTREQVPVRRDAEGLLERSREVGLARRSSRAPAAGRATPRARRRPSGPSRAAGGATARGPGLQALVLDCYRFLFPRTHLALALTFVRRAIGWLASPRRRTGLRRVARPHGCRGSALPCAWTRRAEQDAATCRGRKPP